ncbi:MAG: hypothetical protein ABIK85_00050 [Candidatus Eisenbacteria bacterium]
MGGSLMSDRFDDTEMQTLLAKEEEKLLALRELVDSACEEIMGGRLDRSEATVLAQRVRRQASEIIPDLMDTFDLIYKSRFERLISQYINGSKRAGERA